MLRWLRKAFTQNLSLKFTALVCAVVVWVYADGTVMAERTIAVSVVCWTSESYEVRWRDGTPWSERPPGAVLNVRGPRACLLMLEPDTVCLSLHYMGAPPGDKVMPLYEEDVVFPRSAGDRLEVLDVSPRSLLARIVRTDPPQEEAVESP